MKMFKHKAAKEIRAVAEACDNYQIVCKLTEDDQPTVLVLGHDPTGRKLLVATVIDPGWVNDAQCSGQFVAEVADQIRAILGSSSYADRKAMLGRVMLQGTLLPLLDQN